jgi:Sap, sulfolipid-1-addressing protein
VSAGNVSELVLVSLAAMLSPTTLTFSVLALVLADRPLRTGFLFFLGAFTVTIVIGVIAAFVLGDVAASHRPDPKTWVAILDLVLAAILIVFAGRRIRRPVDPRTTRSMIEKMRKVASSPAVAVVGAGAMLANPGAFIPIALKAISESGPSHAGYVLEWLAFTVIALLPLIVALVLLAVVPDPAERLLERCRQWLERHAPTVGYTLVLLLGIALLRNGIAGLT